MAAYSLTSYQLPITCYSIILPLFLYAKVAINNIFYSFKIFEFLF